MDAVATRFSRQADELMQAPNKFHPTRDVERYNQAALYYTAALASSILSLEAVDSRPTSGSRAPSSSSGHSQGIFPTASANITALADLIRNSLVRRNDPAVQISTNIPLPPSLSTTLHSITDWSPEATVSSNAFKISHKLVKALYNATLSSEEQGSPSPSPSHSQSIPQATLNQDILDNCDVLAVRLSELLLIYSSTSRTSTSSTNSASSSTSPLSDSPKSPSATITDDTDAFGDGSTLADSPLATPYSSSEYLPSAAIAASSKLTNTRDSSQIGSVSPFEEEYAHDTITRHEVVEPPSRLIIEEKAGPSNSGISSSASSFAPTRARTRTRASSLFSLCSSSVRSSAVSSVRHCKLRGDGSDSSKPKLIKSISTISVSSTAKSSMGSFTPITAKTAVGSLRSLSAPQYSIQVERVGNSWGVTAREKGLSGARARTSLFNTFSPTSDDTESDSDELEHVPESLSASPLNSDEEIDLGESLRSKRTMGSMPRRISIKNTSPLAVPSVVLTQASFSPPSAFNSMAVVALGGTVPTSNPANNRHPNHHLPPSVRQKVMVQQHRLSKTQAGEKGAPLVDKPIVLPSKRPIYPHHSRTSSLPTPHPRRPSMHSLTLPSCGTNNAFPPLDPTLAALEKKCKLKLKVKCSDCGVNGWDFSRGRNGEAFCSRECRLNWKKEQTPARPAEGMRVAVVTGV